MVKSSKFGSVYMYKLLRFVLLFHEHLVTSGYSKASGR